MDRTPLSGADVLAACQGLPDWRPRLGALHTAYRAGSVAGALQLVARVGALAEQVDHHPDVDWRRRLVFVTTTTHSAGRRVTAADVDLAARVSDLASTLGAEPVPGLSRTVEVDVDTADPDAPRAVWAQVLGYRPAPDGALVDPHGRGPSVWFQVTPTPAGSRLHLDVDVAAEGVVGAAVAAGGRADDREAPAFTVVTDADGNRMCVCTPLGREDPAS